MQYAKLPGLTWDGTIYENGDMGTLEALLPTGGYPTAHSPAMVELPNGDLLCCWFAGTYEGSADIHIVCSTLPKDAPAWLPPVDISGDPTRSEQNPSLFYGPDNAVWAMYTAQLDRQEGKDNMQYTAVVRCQKSTDGGKTWGSYETIFPEEEPSAASPSRSCPMDVGFFQTGCARIQWTGCPVIPPPSASRTTRERPGE